MGLFDRSIKVSASGLFNGRTDWHCHILPGVDDGFKRMDDSLAALVLYEQAGIKEVWLTPHIMEDIPNRTSALRERFVDLTLAYTGPIRLHLASENMMDALFEQRLLAGDLLPLKDKRLLVETSYFQPPIDLRGTLERIKEAGYTPILAHPERYRYMNDSDYEYLVSKNIKLQLNIVSLAGGYGKPAQEKAQMLLSKGYYNFFGSDLHFLPHFMQAINSKAVKKEYATLLPNIQNTLV